MEGVMVSAKKNGGTITITVASDQNGRYSFPRNRLEAGQYSLRIRAVGYELDDPGAVEVSPAAAAAVDLKLHKAQNLAAQITNAEWIQSIPTPDQQKIFLLNCVQCHTLERILRSKHDAADFMKVMERMGNYANQSFPYHPQKRMADAYARRARRSIAENPPAPGRLPGRVQSEHRCHVALRFQNVFRAPRVAAPK